MIKGNQEQGSHRLAMLLLQQTYSQDCRQCRDTLEDYCLAQQTMGEHKLAAYTSITSHLDVCVDCAECYELIYSILLPDTETPVPEHYPVPNLSFLIPRPVPAEPLRSQLAQACEHYGARLRLSFSQALLALLPPPPQLALRSMAAQPMFELHLSWPEQAIEGLHLQVFSSPVGLADVQVQVYQHERQWPDLLHARVLLSIGAQHYQADSDAFGTAILNNIPIDTLAISTVEVALI